MSAWLYQPGYPIVFIDFDQNVQQFVISQRPEIVNNQTSHLIEWPIPIWTTCAINSKLEKLFWIKPNSSLAFHLTDVTTLNDTNAVIFNQNRAFYYKLVYRY
jgi:aminopeptidase N